ncbi:MAG: hypothetical protein ABIR08_03315 [Sphingomonas sp.]
MRDDNLEPENSPVKHTITKADHDRIRAAYFESKAQAQAEMDYVDAQGVRLRAEHEQH